MVLGMVFEDGQSNIVIQFYSPRTSPGYHGNEIWDKMGYNSASVKDISKIFAFNGKFLEKGYWIRLI